MDKIKNKLIQLNKTIKNLKYDNENLILKNEDLEYEIEQLKINQNINISNNNDNYYNKNINSEEAYRINIINLLNDIGHSIHNNYIDDNYYKLKNLDLNRLNLNEIITLKFYSTFDGLKISNTNLMNINTELKFKIKELSDIIDKKDNEIEFTFNKLEHDSTLFNSKIKEYNINNSILRSKFDGISQENQELRERVNNYKIYEQKCKKYEIIIKEFEVKEQIYNEFKNFEEFNIIKDNIELLNKEIDYNEKEIKNLNNIIREKEQIINEYKQHEKDNNVNLINSKFNNEKNNNELYLKDLNKYKLTFEEELLNIKTNLEIEYNAKYNLLNDQKEEFYIENKKLNKEIKENESKIFNIKLELNKEISQLKIQNSELLCLLKVKQEELISYKAIEEDFKNIQNNKKLEIQLLKDKIILLRNELNKNTIRVPNNQKNLELEAELEIYKKFDTSIAQLIKEILADDDLFSSNFNKEFLTFNNKLNSIVVILKNYQRITGQIKLIEVEKKSLKSENSDLQNKLTLKRDLELNPQSSIIYNLYYEKSHNLNYMNDRYRSLEKDYKLLNIEYKTLQLSNNDLQSKINKVVLNKEEIQNLKQIVNNI